MSAYSPEEQSAYNVGYRLGFSMGKAKETYVQQLEAQRDELLAACQSAANGPEPTTEETRKDWIATIRQLAQAAIAKVEGKAQ